MLDIYSLFNKKVILLIEDDFFVKYMLTFVFVLYLFIYLWSASVLYSVARKFN